MESQFPYGETWRQQDWRGSGAPVVREQADEIIQALLAGTDPLGEDARERLREHVAAHPGNPETALREHLVFSRSLLRHMSSKPRSHAENPPQHRGEQDGGVPAKNRAAVEAILQGHRLVTAFQPIQDLTRNEVVGAEALTRFVWENGDDAGSLVPERGCRRSRRGP